ncbi:MAG TPA: GNAT family N-acetyltransferase [Streptosporangiaceae bacterium]|nr:GNAT family N-acetyltransferase [Streptosporangiaceae bacterium]
MSDVSAVIDDQGESRFELSVDSEVAELTYRRHADRLVLVHTGVPDALAGQGIGGQLVRAAADRAKRDHLTLVPLCPFARAWLERHTDIAGKINVDWGAPPDD